MKFHDCEKAECPMITMNVEYIKTLFELFSLNNFVVIYKFHNNHLKRMFYGEMVDKLKLPEKRTWRGFVRNMNTLRLLNGKVIKCIETMGLFKESYYYKVELFLNRVSLVDCNDGKRTDIDISHVSKTHFLFDPFIQLNDFNYRRVRRCTIVVNQGVDINIFRNIYRGGIKKLKLTK